MTGFLFPVSRFLFSILFTRGSTSFACPGCGGRLCLIGTIGHRAVIDKILRYLGLPGETVEPAPPRHPESAATVQERSADRDVGLVVCNAGINPEGEFDELSPETHERMLDLNIRAPVLLA